MDHRRRWAALVFSEAYEPGVEAVLKLWGAETDPEKRQHLNWLTPMLTYESEALAARYEAAISGFPNLELRLNTAVEAVEAHNGRIEAVTLAPTNGKPETVRPQVIIDGTFMWKACAGGIPPSRKSNWARSPPGSARATGGG